MYKQVKRVSLTFALFVFSAFWSMRLFAPPPPNPMPLDGGPTGPTPINETLFFLVLIGILLGFLARRIPLNKPA